MLYAPRIRELLEDYALVVRSGMYTNPYIGTRVWRCNNLCKSRLADSLLTVVLLIVTLVYVDEFSMDGSVKFLRGPYEI
jgi:hypothetical protein